MRTKIFGHKTSFTIKAFAALLVMIPVMLMVFSHLKADSRASAATTGTVTASSLYVRTGPGTNYDKVTVDGSAVLLAKGDYVAISYESSGWYYITASYKGKKVTGYVSAAYIATAGNIPTGAPSATPTKAPTATPTKAASATKTPTPTPKSVLTTEVVKDGFPLTGYVTAGSLNVRDGAGTEKTRIDGIKSGQKVTITEALKAKSGEYWYHITYTVNGTQKTGYVSAAYVSVDVSSKVTPTPTPGSKTTPTPVPTGGTKVTTDVMISGFPYTGYCTSSGLNIRKGPNISREKVTSISKDQQVTVTGFEYDPEVSGKVWYKVTFTKNNVTYSGYASALYIAVNVPVATSTPAPTKAPDATATPTPKPTATPTPAVSFTGDEIKLSEVDKSEITSFTFTGIVNTYQLNLRSTTATDSAATGIYPQGTKVIILDRVTENGLQWYKVAVKSGGQVGYGYMSAKYTKLTFTENVYAVVTEDGLRLANTASQTSAYVKDGNGNIVSLPAGTEVEVIDETNLNGTKWFKIRTKSGFEGYITATSADLIAELSPEPVATPTPKPAATATPVPQQTTPVPTQDPNNTPTPSPVPTKEVYDPYTGRQMYHYYVYTVINGVTSLLTSGVDYYFPAISMSAPIGYIFDDMEVFPADLTTGFTSFIKAHNMTCDETYYYYYVRDPNAQTVSDWNSGMSSAEFESYMDSQGFPESYKPYLRSIHAAYPSWILKAMQTGISWDDAVSSENVVGRNLIPNSYGIAWKSLETGAYSWATDTFILYDGSTWVTASAATLGYFMDPRNWLNSTNIFMFESLVYQPDYQTVEGVEALLVNTPFYHTSYTYIDDGGVPRTITYAETFIIAANYSGVSPYHLAARVRQEIVTSSTTVSNSATGTVDGYEGLYNFYNIGAYHSTVKGGAIINGLKYARNGASNSDELNDSSLIPWTDPYRAIVGGAYIIGRNYINRGQDTIYLQKFNMTADNTFMHQYMANVVAPSSESKRMATAYTDVTTPVTFSIPVFDNMPDEPSPKPGTEYNPNNWLKNIVVYTSDGNGMALIPSFNASIDQEYYVTVSGSTDMVQIASETVSSKATVYGNGMVGLNYGINTFVITVTAENGDVRNYVVHVVRQE